jgi:hypothetical protein
MSAETPPTERESAQTRRDLSADEVSNNDETVICGRDGRIATIPTPAPGEVAQGKAEDQPEDCFAEPQRSKHWRDSLRHGKPRWKLNGRSSR